jgi:hypothetical protein
MLALILVLLGGGLAVVIVAPRCDWKTPGSAEAQITNDTETAVDVVKCLDDRCTTADSRTAIAPRASGALPVEGCGLGTLAVLDPATGDLSGCIPEPTLDWRSRLEPLAISEAGPCAEAVPGTHVVVAGP